MSAAAPNGTPADMLLPRGFELLEVVRVTPASLTCRAVRLADDARVFLKCARQRSFVGALHYDFMVARVLANVPGVVRVSSFHEGGSGLAAVEMEDLGPDTLVRHCERTLSAPLSAVLSLAVSLTRVFAAIHARGYVHLDIKPSNVMVTHDGPVVIDFGLSRQVPEEGILFSRGQATGTPAYMSPEQTGRLGQALDTRSDLYSLGCTLYALLTGHPPFTGSDGACIHAHLARMPQPPSSIRSAIPRAIDLIILKCLAKSAVDRYQSAAGLAADLQTCLDAFEQGTLPEPFALGTHDIQHRVVLDAAMFGQTLQMERATEYFRSGSVPCVIYVSGTSGVGKTHFVNTLLSAMCRTADESPAFLCGKFDQMSRNAPMSAIHSVLSDLVNVLNVLDADVLDQIIHDIKIHLGNQCPLVPAAFPVLAFLFSSVAAAPPGKSLPAMEHMQAYRALVQTLFVISRTIPLHLFVDDLQWADGASVAFLSEVVQDKSLVDGFSLVMAYRSEATLDPVVEHDLLGKSASALHIQLDPLSKADLTAWMAASFKTSHDNIQPLADAIHVRTGGNPFYTRAFVAELQRRGAVFHLADSDTTGWAWDLDQVAKVPQTKNVVEFLIKQAAGLAQATSRILSAAAFVGGSFDSGLLSQALVSQHGIIGQPPTAAASPKSASRRRRSKGHRHSAPPAVDHAAHVEALVGSAIDEGIRRGLLVRKSGSDTECAFVHDRVQQAFMDVLTTADKEAVQLGLGVHAWMHRDPDDPSLANDFHIASLLNPVHARITDDNLVRALALINARVAENALVSIAYQTAVEVARHGLCLCQRAAQGSGPELVVVEARLLLVLGDALTLLHEHDGAMAILTKGKALCREHGLKVWYGRLASVHAKLLLNQSDNLGAVDIALEALQYIGVSGLCKDPTGEQIGAAFATAAEALDKAGTLADLPVSSDETIQVAFDIMGSMIAPAFLHLPTLFQLMAAEMARISAVDGYSSGTFVAFAMYGFLLSAQWQVGQGHAISEAGYQLHRRHGGSVHLCLALILHGDCLQYWRHHISAGVPLLEQARQAGVDEGQTIAACYVSNHMVTNLLMSGAFIPDALLEAGRQIAFVNQVGYEEAVRLCQGPQRVMAMLAGETRGLGSFSDRIDEPANESKPSTPLDLTSDNIQYKVPAALLRLRSRSVRSKNHTAPRASSLADRGLPIVDLDNLDTDTDGESDDGAEPSKAMEVPVGSDEDDRVLDNLASWSAGTVCWYSIFHMQGMWMSGVYHRAALSGQRANDVLAASIGHMQVADFHCFYALSLLATIQAPFQSQHLENRPSQYPFSLKEALELADEQIKTLRQWASESPLNFEPRLALVEAERARIQTDFFGARSEGDPVSNPLKIIRLYEVAIETAVVNRFPNFAAIASELLGRYMLQHKLERSAPHHMQAAARYYSVWGAKAKIRQLSKLPVSLNMTLTAMSVPGSFGYGSSGANSRSSMSSLDDPTTTYLSQSTNEGRLLQDELDRELLVKISVALSNAVRLEDLVSVILHLLLERTGADRGAILLTNPDARSNRLLGAAELSLYAVSDVSTLDDASPVDFVQVPFAECRDKLALSVVKVAVRTRKDVVVGDAGSASSPFSTDPYIKDTAVRSLLVHPFFADHQLQGVLYCENSALNCAFSAVDVELLSMVSSQMAICIKNSRMYERLESVNESLSHFVPRQFLETLDIDITHPNGQTMLGRSQERVMTVLFADIRGFTSISESMSPAACFRFVNHYLALIGPIVRANGGFIDKYIGDAIMALYPNAAGGVASALEIVRQLRDAPPLDDIPKISIGIGLHTGPLVVGTLGETKRVDCTVIGDAVNLASRFEGATKQFGCQVLVSRETLDSLPTAMRTGLRLRPLGNVAFKGKKIGSDVFDLFDADAPEQFELKEKTADDFSKGIAHFRARQAPEARACFKRVLHEFGDDRASRVFLDKCDGLERLMQELDAFTGTLELSEK